MRVRFVVSGQVQGVAYRASAVEAAERMQLSGWVRNRQDGSVEGVVEGKDDDVEAFLIWCEAGPPLARVTSLDRSADESTSALPPFCVFH